MPDERDFAPRDDSVMVSRSFAEWEEHRAELIKAIESAGLKPAVLGHYELTNAGVIEASLRLVETSGALALIIGEKYGSIPDDAHLNPNQLSLAELEFDYAVRLGKPVVAFINEEPLLKQISPAELETETKLEVFRAKVEPNRAAVYFFETLVDFRRLAASALNLLSKSIKLQPKPPSSPVRGHSGVSSATFSGAEDRNPVDQSAEAVALERPLVFISGSHKDAQWRELFERLLDKYAKDIEWWDDSKLQPGQNWPTEIDAARGRAQLALVLLSPDYLSGRGAIAELGHLAALARSSGLKLFPIVVRDCEWENLAEVREIQVWANGKSLQNLSTRERAAELNKIAASILTLLGKTASAPVEDQTATIETAADLRFSAGAQQVLDQARRLASQTGRERITSSCLLFGFGFADAQLLERDSAGFVKGMLEKTGKYLVAFEIFVKEGKPGDKVNTSIGDVTRNVAAVLEYAQIVASTISPGIQEVHQRHLLAALLFLPGRKGKLQAHKRLKDIGIERSQYLADFLDFVRTTLPEENPRWLKLLKPGSDGEEVPSKSPFVAGPAGYTSEFCGVGGKRPVDDYLFVGAHADRLGELIALRETKLPLAIGLFGNWGSGKSHFMNLIDRRLKALMKEESDRPAGSPQRWCREIVPIYFNAWHYLDANLWASLVAHIFESLFVHLTPKGNDLEEVQQLLEQASGAAARAAEELAVAEKATEQARNELSVAAQNRVQAETVVDGLLHGLKSLLPEVTLARVQKQSGDLLGLEKEMKTIDDLRQTIQEAGSLTTRSRALWKRFWNEPGRGWRIAFLSVRVVVGAAIAALAAMYLPIVKDWLRPAGTALTTLVGAISGLLWWLLPRMSEAGRRLKQMEKWADDAEAEQRRLRETDDVKAATLRVAAATATEEAARIQLAAAQNKENQLKEEALSLSPARKLGRYIEQRAQSSDYRGQLGLVSLARRDFQELSNLFANAEALEEKVQSLQKERDTTRRRATDLRASLTTPNDDAQSIQEQVKQLDERAQELEDQAKRIQELSGSIDRIVLFVDDLDRCQPEKIVEILQAVHLLLAFPLFAVVVGVDQRALRQSLRMQFKGLLGLDRAVTNGDKDQEIMERAATPLDYLEKIFHVPFHLPIMGKDGFEQLIEKLTQPSPDSPTQVGQATVDVPRSGPAKTTLTPKPDVQPRSVPFASEIPGMPTPTIGLKTQPDMGRPEPIIVTPVPAPSEPELIGSVPLQSWERKALRDYHTMIQTPRGATRLLNTYRLVRAAIPKQEWDSFSSGEYRIAMLLLAAAAGYPASVREWFSELMKPEAESFSEADAKTPGWNNFKRLYDENFGATEHPSTDVMVKWINRVETFTF